MNTVIIGLGSNIHPEENISEAIRLLGESVTILKVSNLVRTSPVGITEQPDFINGAIKILTGYSKDNLLPILKHIEDALGRNRSLPKFGPRTIDLDIIVWNGEIIHDDYYLRDFIRNSVQELLE